MTETAYFTDTHNPTMNVACGAFVSRRCFGASDGFEAFASMGCFRDGRMIGAVIFHNWDDAAGVMELSAAGDSPRWLTAHVIREMHRFPFDLMGAQMVLHRVKSTNARMISLHRRFGASEVVIPRGFGRDVDCHVFTVTDDAWRAHPVYIRGEAR